LLQSHLDFGEEKNLLHLPEIEPWSSSH
jgi:hypothetical protein